VHLQTSALKGVPPSKAKIEPIMRRISETVQDNNINNNNNNGLFGVAAKKLD